MGARPSSLRMKEIKRFLKLFEPGSEPPVADEKPWLLAGLVWVIGAEEARGGTAVPIPNSGSEVGEIIPLL